MSTFVRLSTFGGTLNDDEKYQLHPIVPDVVQPWFRALRKLQNIYGLLRHVLNANASELDTFCRLNV